MARRVLFIQMKSKLPGAVPGVFVFQMRTRMKETLSTALFAIRIDQTERIAFQTAGPDGQIGERPAQ
jgi:hypothetical protein